MYVTERSFSGLVFRHAGVCNFVVQLRRSALGPVFPTESGRKSTIAVTSSERLGQTVALETCECVIMQIPRRSGMKEEVGEQEVG